MELGAFAYWLLDPSVSAHQRACRNLVSQLGSAYEAERVASTAGWHQTVRELGISPTVAELREKFDSLGLTITGQHGDRRRPLSVDGVATPTATASIKDLVRETPYSENAAIAYSTLSATTHGTLYGLMRMFMSTEEIANGERVIERFADHRVIEASAGLTMTAFVVVLRRAVQIMDWDHWKALTLGNMMGSILVDGPR
jgi:hypothetical protein